MVAGPRRWGRALLVAAIASTFLATTPAANAAPKQERQWAELETELNGVVTAAAAEGITLSVTVNDLAGWYCHRTLTAGGDEVVKAASVIKLALLAKLMDDVDHGSLRLSTMVHIPSGSSNIVGGSGTLRNRDFPLDISIDELMHLMVQVSDNTATNVLIDVAGGFDAVNDYIGALGFEDLWLGRKMIHPAVPPLQENWISSSEVTELIVDLWEGTILSRTSSDYIINLMKGQLVNTKYGAVIPREFLANKTGELADVSHDSGIILIPGKELALTTTTAWSNELPRTYVDTFVQQTARIAFEFAQLSLPGDRGNRPEVSYCRGDQRPDSDLE